MLDPRDGRTLLCASRQWHLGPTVFRSEDGGATWKEAVTPPRFPTGEPRARAVDHVFALTPGLPSEPGVWYAGTSPQALFRSEDGGVNWAPVSGFNDHPEQARWVGSDKDQTPDGGKLHSIVVDPRDPRHLYLGLSGGGIFESVDGGADWTPLNSGVAMDFAPPREDGSEYPYGHDPHCIAIHPLRPDRCPVPLISHARRGGGPTPGAHIPSGATGSRAWDGGRRVGARRGGPRPGIDLGAVLPPWPLPVSPRRRRPVRRLRAGALPYPLLRRTTPGSGVAPARLAVPAPPTGR